MVFLGIVCIEDLISNCFKPVGLREFVSDLLVADEVLRERPSVENG